MIEPRAVEVFYWVVRLGGFRKAAERLGTTQPAVSGRVAALEAAVAARLLERGPGRRLGLTPAGMLMLSFAERHVAWAGEMAAAFKGADGMRGRVRLGVAETLVHTWLPELLRRLAAAMPLVELDMAVEVSSAMRAALVAGEMDVALLLGPVVAPGVAEVALCEYPLAWMVRAGHALEGRRIGPAELAGVPIVTYPRQTTPYHQVRRIFAGRPAPRILALSSLASMVRLVLDGVGVGVLAPAGLPDETSAKRLVTLEGPALPPLRFHAAWRDAPGSGLAATVGRMAEAVARGE